MKRYSYTLSVKATDADYPILVEAKKREALETFKREFSNDVPKVLASREFSDDGKKATDFIVAIKDADGMEEEYTKAIYDLTTLLPSVNAKSVNANIKRVQMVASSLEEESADEKQKTIEAMQNIFRLLGIPSVVVNDNGTKKHKSRYREILDSAFCVNVGGNYDHESKNAIMKCVGGIALNVMEKRECKSAYELREYAKKVQAQREKEEKIAENAPAKVA